MKKVAVIFADGFEEIEGVSIVDVLRRGGVEAHIVGLDKLPITGAHGVKFVCDMTLYDLEVEEYDMLVLGGTYVSDKNVVQSGNIITSKGPATAIEFALELVKILNGEQVYNEVKNGLLFVK